MPRVAEPDSTVLVIMATFRHEAFVGEAIASVRAQTFASWELVVVDDGSTDRTVVAAQAAAGEDARIRIVEQRHVGLEALATSYALALGRSSAPLVAILEGDDRWPPDKLARQVPDFDDPEVVLSYGAGDLIDAEGRTYAHVRPFSPGVPRTNRPVGSLLPALRSGNPVLSPTVVIRRSALDAIGGFWQPAGVPYVDHPTWLRLATAGAFAYHLESVGEWRRHPAQWTTRTVEAAVASPEAAYCALPLHDLAGRPVELAVEDEPDAGRLFAAHTRRAALNRWRLALLGGTWADIVREATRALREIDARLASLVLVGLLCRLAGSDLEWLQVRRGRVAWPGRRRRPARTE